MTGLLSDLRALVGGAQVLVGPDADGFARDWTGKYRARPVAVVRPADTAEVSGCIRAAAAHGVAVVPVGGNTGLVGGVANDGALMISLERMDAIRDIKPEAGVAVVEAGVVLADLRRAAEARDMIFPLTFGAQGSARIGGALSTNAGGSNVVRYGSTRGLVLGLEVVLADGRVLDLMGQLRKDNSGYALKDLFIGAEGTLGLITAAALRLLPRPRHHATALVRIAGLPAALRLLRRLQEASDGAVEAFEYMPRPFMERLALVRPDLRQPFAPGDHQVMIEIAGLSRPLGDLLETALGDALEAGDVDEAAIARSEAQRRAIWAMREAAAEITFDGRPVVDTDIAVPLDAVGTFLHRFEARLSEMDADATHLTVGHLGDGNLHVTVYPSRPDGDHADALRQMIEAEVLHLGGSFSAEHGIGLSKLGSMRRHKDPVALDVMRAVKAALDPEGRMNPGKVVPGPDPRAPGPPAR